MDSYEERYRLLISQPIPPEMLAPPTDMNRPGPDGDEYELLIRRLYEELAKAA